LAGVLCMQNRSQTAAKQRSEKKQQQAGRQQSNSASVQCTGDRTD
jgi:hypothetical protein